MPSTRGFKTLFRKKKPDITVQAPLVLQVPPEQAEKDKLELKLLEHKAVMATLEWDVAAHLHEILDHDRPLKYIQ